VSKGDRKEVDIKTLKFLDSQRSQSLQHSDEIEQPVDIQPIPRRIEIWQTIIRWDPFAEMASLRETFDRLFEDPRSWRTSFGNVGNFLPVDVLDTADEIVVKASLPGVKPEDIDISVEGQLLTLKGESREEREEKAENWYHRERRQGSFVRQVQLPTEVDSSKAEAVFENGVLRLALPKAETVKPKSIKVQARPTIEAGSR
jgi:HSP20 family protein